MAATDYSGSDTALTTLLRAWQSHTRALLADVHPKQHPEGVLAVAGLAQRGAALRRLRWTMLPRESRKRRFLAPCLRLHFFSDDDIAALDELVERKLAFEKQLILLRWADERSRLFDDELKELIDQINGYLQCEERLLPRLATQLPTVVQDELTRRLAAQGGTRGWHVVQPHPDLPRTRWIAVATEPLAAVLDRLRDRLSTAPG